MMDSASKMKEKNKVRTEKELKRSEEKKVSQHLVKTRKKKYVKYLARNEKKGIQKERNTSKDLQKKHIRKLMSFFLRVC